MATTGSHPGAVSLLTALGNTITLTLREPDIQRVADLLAAIVRDDAAVAAQGDFSVSGEA